MKSRSIWSICLWGETSFVFRFSLLHCEIAQLKNYAKIMTIFKKSAKLDVANKHVCALFLLHISKTDFYVNIITEEFER
ncbi:hypothetical protein CVD25_04865 [Bacillus canaveralius]|uniref:Uncharacterized protein n=1 Tax=Bacillus canaveralius TaxID=1403243 RepID=A0A2N5GRI1_9BACI|nr:hypothetical protein CVD23_11530 [Bacillus sp. V33-4]PLR86047.1 hypothetical protein CU635_03155 [Bacillus canaveralius]PLS00166.1 hypothetical protein CVD25_04865 [Bacillus canaveralius]